MLMDGLISIAVLFSYFMASAQIEIKNAGK